MKNFFKVLSQSEAVNITRQDGSIVTKSTIVLQELGGKFENSFVCALLGQQLTLHPGDFVYAALRFAHREHNGNLYQDITIQEIVKLGE